MKTVVALYDDFTEAQAVVRDLTQAGVARKNISLVTSDRDSTYARELDDLGDDHDGNHVAEGAGAGAVAGGVAGGMGGLLVGLGALAIPGIGPIVAAGPIAAGLIGAGVGAAAGGVIGALIGWGIPEDEANYFAEGVRRGGTLIGVTTTDEDVSRVTDILNKYNPVDLESRSADWRNTGWTGFDTTAQPYTGSTTADLGATRGTYARLYDHQSKGSFDDVDYGEGRGRETHASETEGSFADVDGAYGEGRGRETHASVTEGSFADVDYSDDEFVDYEPSYRGHFDTTYRNRGFAYNDYQNAYRFGTTMGNDARYTNYNDWADAEPVARQQWENSFESAWDDFSDAVKHGWSQVKQAVR